MCVCVCVFLLSFSLSQVQFSALGVCAEAVTDTCTPRLAKRGRERPTGWLVGWKLDAIKRTMKETQESFTSLPSVHLSSSDGKWVVDWAGLQLGC